MVRAVELFTTRVPAFDEDRLRDEIALPWRIYSVEEMLGFFYWNNTYHVGQIGTIQLMLGDDVLCLH